MIERSGMQMLSSDELKELNQERRPMLDLQMPTFIRGDEDEDAEELFYLPRSPPLLHDRPLTPMDRLHDFNLNTIRRTLQRCRRFAHHLRALYLADGPLPPSLKPAIQRGCTV